MNLAPAYADPEVLSDALVERHDDRLRALLVRMHQTVLVDPRPLLASVRAPTLLPWGQPDAMIPISNSADYLSEAMTCWKA